MDDWKDTADRLLQERGETRFTPFASYNPDGDCIEFFAKPDSYYAKRVDDLVTVYYSHETNKLVGALFKGVSKAMDEIRERIPGFLTLIDEERRIRTHHLFLARYWSSPPEPGDAREAYKDLLQVSEESNTQADYCLSGSH